jgi:hypothetical protein
VTPRLEAAVTQSLASVLLTSAALVLAGVGISINGWFATQNENREVEKSA